jgi:hypothetical protein
MALSHREEEIVKIVTPLALEAVEEDAEQSGEQLSDREKAMAVAETVDEFVEDLEGQKLNIPCDGPYCEICGMCAL